MQRKAQAVRQSLYESLEKHRVARLSQLQRRSSHPLLQQVQKRSRKALHPKSRQPLYPLRLLLRRLKKLERKTGLKNQKKKLALREVLAKLATSARKAEVRKTKRTKHARIVELVVAAPNAKVLVFHEASAPQEASVESAVAGGKGGAADHEERDRDAAAVIAIILVVGVAAAIVHAAAAAVIDRLGVKAKAKGRAKKIRIASHSVSIM